MAMIRRFVRGGVWGGLLGLAIAAGCAFSWNVVNLVGWKGWVFGMAVAAVAAVMNGKRLWEQDGFVEGMLKALAALFVGAAAWWAATTFMAAPLGFLGIPDWTHSPFLFGPAVGATVGAFIAADHTDEAKPAKALGSKSAASTSSPSSQSRVQTN